MSRLEQYFSSFKTLVMLYYIGGLALAFIGGYLVGSNNPLPAVKKKIIDQAKSTVNKL